MNEGEVGGVYLEDFVVEEDHDDARYVEGRQWRVDDKIRVVEHAKCRIPRRRVVQSHDDGQSDGRRNGPHQADGQPDPFVVLVARVLDRLSHGDVPVHQTDSD